jgi:hypothetical protein
MKWEGHFMTNLSRAILLVVVILLVAAYIWPKTPHHETSTEFSSWSHKTQESTSPGEGPGRSTAAAAPELKPQLESRQKVDLDRFLRERGAMGASSREPSPSAQEAFKKLPRAKVSVINGQTYQILGARAVPHNQYSLSMGDSLLTQNNYDIVPLAKNSDDLWRKLTVPLEGRPVLINPDSGRLTIVTGTIMVQLNSLESVGAIADSEHLQVLGVDEAISTAFYKAPSGYSLLEGLARIQARKDIVVRAELELDQSRKVGQ